MFLAHLIVLRLFITVWRKTSKILYLREFSAQVSQIVFYRSFDRFTASYNCMRKNFKNLISPWVQCTSITNRVLSSFDRFTAYYNCMRKTSKISYLREFSAQVSQIVFSVHLTVLRTYYNCMRKNFKNLISPWVHCTSINKSCSQIIWPFTAYSNCMR